MHSTILIVSVLLLVNNIGGELLQINPWNKITGILVEISQGNGVYCAVSTFGQTFRSKDKGKTWHPMGMVNPTHPFTGSANPILGFSGKVFYYVMGHYVPSAQGPTPHDLFTSSDCASWNPLPTKVSQPHSAAIGVLNNQPVVVFATVIPSAQSTQSVAVVANLEFTSVTSRKFNHTDPVVPCNVAYNPVLKEWVLSPWGGPFDAAPHQLTHFVTTQDFNTYTDVSLGFNTTGATSHRLMGFTSTHSFMVKGGYPTVMLYAAPHDGKYNWKLVHEWVGSEMNPPYIRSLVGSAFLGLPDIIARLGSTQTTIPQPAAAAAPSVMVVLDVVGGADDSYCTLDSTTPDSYQQEVEQSGTDDPYYPSLGIRAWCSASNIWTSTDAGMSWKLTKKAEQFMVTAAWLDGNFLGLGYLGNIKSTVGSDVSKWNVVVPAKGFEMQGVIYGWTHQRGTNQELLLSGGGFGLPNINWYSTDEGKTWTSHQIPTFSGITSSASLFFFTFKGSVVVLSTSSSPWFGTSHIKQSTKALLGPYVDVTLNNSPIQGVGVNGTHLLALQNILTNTHPPSLHGVSTLVFSSESMTSYQNHTTYTWTKMCQTNNFLVFSEGSHTWIATTGVTQSMYSGYCVSTDGINWTQKEANLQCGTKLFSVGKNFFGQCGGFVVSTDKGESFQPIGNGVLPFQQSPVDLMGVFDGNYYVAANGTLWFSNGPDYMKWREIVSYPTVFGVSAIIKLGGAGSKQALLIDYFASVYKFSYAETLE